jgi:hypothetical protein
VISNWVEPILFPSYSLEPASHMHPACTTSAEEKTDFSGDRSTAQTDWVNYLNVGSGPGIFPTHLKPMIIETNSHAT